MRAIDWLFVVGVVAMVLGPLLTLRLITRKEKREQPPPSERRDNNRAWDEED